MKLKCPAKWLVLVMFWCLPGIVSAQNDGEVTGYVRNVEGELLPGVNIRSLEISGKGTVTDAQGRYILPLPAGRVLNLVFSFIGYKNDTLPVFLEPGKTRQMDYRFTKDAIELPETIIQDEQVRQKSGTSEINTEVADYIPNPSGGIEALLAAQALGVAKGNELSTGYSVRGGNFDENLVYVNDFEIYRPFLIRSGQQEGMSFVNSALVQSIQFSSGGFEARYGDKLSSVLDVQYKKPKKIGGSVMGSLLGASAHLEGASKNERVTWLFGVRQRSNQYLLRSLEEKGVYAPFFLDLQTYITTKLTDKLELEYIANYSRNRFRFEPIERETTFGVVNNVLRLTMYFDGQENDSYETFMNGLALVQKPNNYLKLKWMASFYKNTEIEAYDIQGAYWLDEVESDFSKDNFGQTKFSRGTGGIHEYTRNRLDAWISVLAHKGFYSAGNHYLQWGAEAKNEIIEDRIHEWEMLDSAGYSLPYNTDAVFASRFLRSDFSLNTYRFSAYVQDSWEFLEDKRLWLNIGARVGYWTLNREFFATPRMQLSFKPVWERDIVLRASAGLYYQPPFYREMRAMDGSVNTALRAQKSLHAVLGADYNFQIWNRPFKFVTEAYYKYMWDLVPYEFDNVLIRYFGQNRATGYAVGLDMRLHGEFVKDAESWISMSFLRTYEDLKDDIAYQYYDPEGNPVPPSRIKRYEQQGIKIDTVVSYPGFIPRPTDQIVTFGMFFQDYLPKYKSIKAHLSLMFGTGLPFGPPDNERYRDTLRIPPYRRVDIGFSALLFDLKKREDKNKTPQSFFRHINSIWATLEIYNLLGVSNTISYLWIKDVTNTVYAVPNYLTARRVNARLVVRF